MKFAILRVAKLKKVSNVYSSALHNFRERETPNSDPERLKENQHWGQDNALAVKKKVKQILAPLKVRKNGVVCLEYFMGMSPEFAKSQPKKVDEYFDLCHQWLVDRHGEENIVTVTRQFDETSPHICAYVVPIDQRGKLNASAFLNGREKLEEMQDDFAEKCGTPVGLMRGLKGSKASHQSVKDWYARMQAETQRPQTELPPKPEPLKGAERLAEKGRQVLGPTDYQRAEKAWKEAREKRNREWDKIYENRDTKAKAYDAQMASRASFSQNLQEMRAKTVELREIQLSRVLERLGAVPDPKDKKNWRTATGRITVTGEQFFDHNAGKGGGGAIDLVMHELGVGFKEALHWLSSNFSSAVATSEVVKYSQKLVNEVKAGPKPDYTLNHKPNEIKWQAVRAYLTEKRGLKPAIVDALHEKGRVFADKFGNAVFKLDGEGGISLRGTGEERFHGVRGEKTFFTIGGAEGVKEVAFVESPIDAISLRQLGFSGRVVATIGSTAKLASKASQYFQHGWKVFAAFDNDQAGNELAKTMGKAALRKLPFSKDWNSDLLRKIEEAKTEAKADEKFKAEEEEKRKKARANSIKPD